MLSFFPVLISNKLQEEVIPNLSSHEFRSIFLFTLADISGSRTNTSINVYLSLYKPSWSWGVRSTEVPPVSETKREAFLAHKAFPLAFTSYGQPSFHWPLPHSQPKHTAQTGKRAHFLLNTGYNNIA